MPRILIFTIFMGLTYTALSGMANALENEPLTANETEEVNVLLDKLYQSFSYQAGEEPDWDLMRSVFVDDAQVVLEPAAGEELRPQKLEDFITSWQGSIRNSPDPTVQTSEAILDTAMTRLGNLIRVDLLFRAMKSTDTAPREPGLDTLMLARVNGDWKILSFVVQYESKLE